MDKNVTNDKLSKEGTVMKKLEVFYQEGCPYCKKALKFINELQEENDIYRLIDIKLTDEEVEIDYSYEFDYFKVPSFYIDGHKVHEGAITKEEMKRVLEAALE